MRPADIQPSRSKEKYMSVTESKTKTERKSSRKPSKEQETALSALCVFS